jgi:hypothetical protein
MPMAPYSDLRLLMISAALALVVLITDLSLPPGVASGVFYVAVVC